ncbi:phosphoribosyltransferase-like protein [Pseudomonas viridiflava]|uniref:phosphoribosyltransferase-like protein n=1 Tax=Pseudomonas viridiflava TaxID=33069 RepID=UPI0010FA8EB9|nr:hypothetical protein [Pseudomonas viridiflava]
MELHETDRGIEWVSQFKIQDRPAALELLKAVRWISAAEFVQALTQSIAREAKHIRGPVALFVEQDLRVRLGKVERFYKQKRKPRRAYGVAIPPVRSKQLFNHEVGSEGIVGSIATALKRRYPKKYLFHPTMEKMRKVKPRAFFILADTVGSGKQAYDVLQAFWNVSTVKSWMSLGLLKSRVICFASTQQGKRLLEKHPMGPEVVFDIQCPTISSAFDAYDAERMIDLCSRYTPQKTGAGGLGFGGEGVLMAYAHGMPNNAPEVFFKASTKWKPLFEARVTNLLSVHLETGLHQVDARSQLKKMKAEKVAASKWLTCMSEDSVKMLLVMVSLARSPRTEAAIASRTNLTIPDVRHWLQSGKHYGWVSDANRLTDDGMLQIKHLKSSIRQHPELVPWPLNVVYYPTSLRMPD